MYNDLGTPKARLQRFQNWLYNNELIGILNARPGQLATNGHTVYRRALLATLVQLVTAGSIRSALYMRLTAGFPLNCSGLSSSEKLGIVFGLGLRLDNSSVSPSPSPAASNSSGAYAGPTPARHLLATASWPQPGWVDTYTCASPLCLWRAFDAVSAISKTSSPCKRMGISHFRIHN